MRNSVPDGKQRSCVLPSGKDKAGGPDDELIERLRETVRSLEQVPVSFGLPRTPGAGLSRSACFSAAFKDELATDHAPPLYHLAEAGLHELKPAAYGDMPSAIGFALGILSLQLRLQRDLRTNQAPAGALLLWCLTQEALAEWGAPYGPGLLRFGLDPAQILIVRARTVRDAAWALEETLKSGTASAVLGQATIPKPVMARRLGLAAKGGGLPCLLITEAKASALPGTVSRWRIASRPSRAAAFDPRAPGHPAWHLTLERCRAEPPERSWTVEWSNETHRFHLAVPLADRAADAPEGGKRNAAP